MDPSATILAVDDSPENLVVISGLLHPGYRVLAATSGEKALRIAMEQRPDLILLDVMMPGMNGYQVFEKLRGAPETLDIPVIFITAMEGSEAELKGLELGAVDYLTKPIDPPIVLARVRNQLELKRARDLLAGQNAFLEREVNRRMRENESIQEISIRALANLAETRDLETGNHILRTQGYVRRLAERLRSHDRFAPWLDETTIALLARSATLHDIGKVGIPDAILLKPGRLDAAEWEIMKTHALLGAQAIERAESGTDRPVPFLGMAREIARWHHEKWDGSGYPDGLVGEDIPFPARIMAIADVFDALITPRVYKKALPFTQARDLIAEGSGHHFDPRIAQAFLDGFADFTAIADRYGQAG